MYAEKGVISEESTPKCIIKGSARHFNILANNTINTLLLLDTTFIMQEYVCLKPHTLFQMINFSRNKKHSLYVVIRIYLLVTRLKSLFFMH